ncbi:damage-control phosphatase ARMT1 [Drosophila pseudoobscura]|uniref:Sugar phosphate phosphatase n=1 Tax=Drosophila pseudoobscura pseudoobscura TaxID=46245 RepID=A0A6I8UW14_DROPS|nr:damage-control phosphatase ARMT1 [Drosophila pseudoobscura]
MESPSLVRYGGQTEDEPKTKSHSERTDDGSNIVSRIFKTEFDAKYKIYDMRTPLNAFMCGQYKRSGAYNTLRNRLPVVLTNVIDTLTKDKSELVAEFGEAARGELKIIIGLISRLKYELQTDKPFQGFDGQEPDRALWNKFLNLLPDEERTFFRSCCLYSECYMHRKLYSFVENSIFLKPYDYHVKVKENSLTSCIDDVLSLTKYTRRTDNSLEMFGELLRISLWSNYNDTTRDPEAPPLPEFNINVLEDVSAADEFILVNQVADIWQCLDNRKQKKPCQVDFVLDNAGYELFTDIILAEFMIEKGLATKVLFHVKAHPWFVTDVTARDFKWTLEYLSQHADYIISLIGKKFLQFLAEGKFQLAPISHFWTCPYPYYRMRDTDPDLYSSLQQSKLIVFKGDLNYRKLLQDVCWDSTQDLNTCLRGFLPSNICAVRRVKAEVICGLPEGVSETLSKKDPHWMISGNYGVIQFVDGSREFGY